MHKVPPDHPDYTNSDVIRLREKMGLYEYGPHKQDHVKREMRKICEVDYSQKYEGEWNVEDNTRDGRGVMFWEDGSLYEGWW